MDTPPEADPPANPHEDRASRRQIARGASSKLLTFAQRAGELSTLVGFDGFVDSIIEVVNKRFDRQHYQPFQTIEAFGKRVLESSGESTNFELVTRIRKIGGNGPIMANAMIRAGLPVTYVGALGHPQIDEVFKPFVRAADCVSLAAPARTDSLEFSDGKLMLGKLDPLDQITWRKIDDVMGADSFMEVVRGASLAAMVNWTMLPSMSEIWRRILEHWGDAETDPAAEPDHQRFFFFDLADPSKRTLADLREALRTIAEFQTYRQVILGMNTSEAEQVAAALRLKVGSSDVMALARAIRERMGIGETVVHPRHGAGAASEHEACFFRGPFVAKPKLSTGAGDHFNVGYCLGRVAGLELAEALCVGSACSGFYVRQGESPTYEQLAWFCGDLPEAESEGADA